MGIKWIMKECNEQSYAKKLGNLEEMDKSPNWRKKK